MILHDTTFEDLAQAPVKQTDVEVAKQIIDPYGSYDDTPIWTSSDILMDVKIDCVGTFLGTTTKKAVVKLLGTTETPVADDVFNIRLGLYDNDPSVSGFNYISEGFFLVDTVDYDYEAGLTTVTMYDHMWKAKNTLYNGNLTAEFVYPATIEELAVQMAAVLGVEVMDNFSDLPNADYAITEDPYATLAGATIQSVIAEIAGATGTTARISDRTLVFSQYEVDDENLDSSTLKKLKIGKKYGPVTSVVLGRVPQNDNIIISSVTPSTNIISSINTTTNLFTVTGHAMPNGNLVQIESTGTLPAPLQVHTNYYVFTNGNANTFALAPTYDDAIAGTNLVDLTTSGSGTITLSNLPTQEIQINNNELLDDDRQTLLPPLYQTLSGIDWSEVDATTVGLGWHEVGDVIQFTQGSTTVNAFINEIHLVLAGSVNERLQSSVPDVASIDYQTAGGIMKTLYNTEIKVDKQGNDITSIVSQQSTYEGQTTTNFSEIYQNLENINLTVQHSGGGNLILNSVGYAKEPQTDFVGVSYDKLLFWDYPEDYEVAWNGTVTSYSSSESQNAGGASGQVIEMSGTFISLIQRINVAENTPLSLGVRVHNALGAGEGIITLYNDNDSFEIVVDESQAYEWEELLIENFVSTMPWLDVRVICDEATRFMFTDLRVLYGATIQGWVQSANEILTAQVQFTKEGMRIFDNDHDTETRVTYDEFSTRRSADGVKLFEADASGIITNDLSIKGSTNYMSGNDTVIKQVTIPASSPLGGVAFIRVS